MSHGSYTLQCRVGNPKVDASSKKIDANFLLNFEVGKQKWSTTRQYRGFLKLNKELKPTLKRLGIPPLKSASRLTKSNATKVLTKQRTVLQQFLTDLANHGETAELPEFKMFVDTPGYAPPRKKKPKAETPATPTPDTPKASSPKARAQRSSPRALSDATTSSAGNDTSPRVSLEQLEKQKEAVERQKAELEKHKAEIEELREHNRKVTMDFTDLQDQLSDYNDLKVTNSGVQAEFEQTLSQLKDSQDQAKKFQSMFQDNKDAGQESVRRVHAMEKGVADMKEQVRKFKQLNIQLQNQVEQKQSMITKFESQIESLQIAQRKAEREKTDVEVARMDLIRKLDQARRLKADPDQATQIIKEIERENELLRETQVFTQVLVEENDPILMIANDKIAELEKYIDDLLAAKTRDIRRLQEKHKAEILRVMTELTDHEDISDAARTEIFVLRKELLVKESDIKNLQIELNQQKKNIEANVYKKYKEKLTGIRTEMSRRLDKFRLELEKRVGSVSGDMTMAEMEDSTNREILRMRRLIVDKEDEVKKLKLELESVEEDFELENNTLKAEIDNLRDVALTQKLGESATLELLKKQVGDLNDDLRAKIKELEKEKKSRARDKIEGETAFKTLQIDFEDLTQSSHRKVGHLEIELTKRQNDFLLKQHDGLHNVEEVEQLHRKYKALKLEHEELKATRSGGGNFYQKQLLQRIQQERDSIAEQLAHLHQSKIQLINALSEEMENMREELRHFHAYQAAGHFRGDPTRAQRRSDDSDDDSPRHSPQRSNQTVDITFGIAEDQKYDSMYIEFTLPSFEPQVNPLIDDL